MKNQTQLDTAGNPKHYPVDALEQLYKIPPPTSVATMRGDELNKMERTTFYNAAKFYVWCEGRWKEQQP